MAHPNFLLNSSTLVIGGSSGIGFAVASAALANGSKVHITSVTPQKLAAKIDQLQSLYPGARVSGTAADLSNTETLEANMKAVLDDAVKEAGGPLDHIVHSAGDGLNSTPLAEVTIEMALQPFTVRYLGSVVIGKLVAAHPGKYLKPTASSSITFTSGIMVHRPRNFYISLGATGAVESLSTMFAVELAPIRTNVIIPGAVRTELLDRVTKGNPDAYKDASLTKQVGTAAEAAEAYLFCMRSTLATGQGFTIDSGYLLA
ncbi:NAD(P)-binding protein [Mycena sanguinolenta]|uniref:NAD(P)-binding protein n=1 Tax=Mycena sanguinolenta TaxID=230812 RepID=A0A8H6XTX3_9AGAR|nr:NAD(P)-binding protein [Mycena sanguinolenta]